MGDSILAAGQITEVLFPFKVYEDTGLLTPEGTALLTLEAGFREKSDASLFIKAKSEKSDKKYVIKMI